MRPANPKFKKSKSRSNKINLVFDEEKRREFLTGFHKRKLQQKKKIKDKLEADLKEERKRLKIEAKESYKKLLLSHARIPELEESIKEYSDDEVTIEVMEVSTNTTAKPNESENERDSRDLTESISEQDRSGKKTSFSSKKHLKKVLKKTATKKVQCSTAFQKKSKIDSRNQKKDSLRQKKLKMKQQKKLMKKNHFRKKQS